MTAEEVEEGLRRFARVCSQSCTTSNNAPTLSLHGGTWPHLAARGACDCLPWHRVPACLALEFSFRKTAWRFCVSWTPRFGVLSSRHLATVEHFARAGFLSHRAFSAIVLSFGGDGRNSLTAGVLT
jgi:hypothetical protein